MANRPGRRVAIVAGLRTPFVKAGTSFKDLSALELGKQVVAELVQRAEIPPKAIDQIVFGTVIPSVQLPNIAREVGIAAGLPKNVDAYSVVRACATSLQAMTSAADAIALGEKLHAFQGVSPRDLLPVPPSIAEYSFCFKDRATTEKMAKENGISREA